MRDGEPFDIHFTSELNKPNGFNQSWDIIRRNLHSTMTFSQFPLKLIPFFHQNQELVEKLGSTLNAQLDIHPVKEDWIGILSFQTQHVILKEAKLALGRNIVLRSPAELKYTLTKNSLKDIFKNDKLELKENQTLTMLLKQLDLSIDHLESTKFQISSSVPQLFFNHLIPHHTSQLDNVELQIEAQNLNSLLTKLTGQFLLLNSNQTTSPFIPEPLNILQTAQVKLNQGGLDNIKGEIQLENAYTHFVADAQMDSKQLIEFLKPIQFNYKLTPLALNSLNHFSHENLPELLEPIELKVNIEPIKINLNNFSPSNIYLQGLTEIKKIAFKDPAEKIPTIENIFMPWVIDSPRNNIYTLLKGVVNNSKDKKSHQISAHLQFWLPSDFFELSKMPTEIRLNLTGFPTNILNLKFNIPQLEHLIGPIIDLNLKSLYPTNEPGYLHAILDSSELHFEGEFKLDQNITLQNPAKSPLMQLTISPQTYRFFKDALKLKDENVPSRPFTLTATISQLEVPLNQKELNKSFIKLDLNSTDILWQTKLAPQ